MSIAIPLFRVQAGRVALALFVLTLFAFDAAGQTEEKQPDRGHQGRLQNPLAQPAGCHEDPARVVLEQQDPVVPLIGEVSLRTGVGRDPSRSVP